jgi:flagellar capping protein FliD
MEDKEAALKAKYGAMEGTLQNLQGTSNYLNGLNSNNNK